MVTINASPERSIRLGYAGEDKVTKVIFPYDESWLEYGDGEFFVRVLRPGDTEPYNAQDVTNDSEAMTLTLVVTDVELSKEGYGQMQAVYIGPQAIKKSPIYRYRVSKAIDEPVKPPDGSIINEVVRSLAELTDEVGDISTALEAKADVTFVDYLATQLAGKVGDVQVNGVSIVDDGVANVPIATESSVGVCRVDPNYGTGIYAQRLMVARAPDDYIKNGANVYRPIVPSTQHSAVFYGFAKAAGDTTQAASSNAVGQYTKEAKSAISDMLNGAVLVEGTTPTITALSGVWYVCGEVATLDFTPCATGICDVVFTSGSTPTVVTLPNTVKFPDGAFTAEANKTYEINVMDGVYGVVMAWT